MQDTIVDEKHQMDSLIFIVSINPFNNFLATDKQNKKNRHEV